MYTAPTSEQEIVTLDTTRIEFDPFGISPDPRFIFLDAKLRLARSALLAELHRGSRTALVYGSRGIGKTILLRSLAADLKRSDHSMVSMSCIASACVPWRGVAVGNRLAVATAASQA